MSSEVLYGLIALIIAPALTGLGWVLARRFTGAKQMEQFERLTASVDLVTKLKGAGLTIAEARQIITDVDRGHDFVLTDSEPDHDDDEPLAYSNTMAMKMRMAARQETLNAEMAAARVDLELLLGDEEMELASQAQAAWEDFRSKQSKFSASLVSGGTAEGLFYLATSIQLTEARIEQIKTESRERQI